MKPYSAQKKEEILIVRRGKFLVLLQTAIASREFQFARQAALIWLASYPGDLLVNFMYAQTLAEFGDVEMAVTNLENLLRNDPEFTEAAVLLDRLTGQSNPDFVAARVYLQRGGTSTGTVSWLPALIEARHAYESGDLAAAEKAVMESLAHNPKVALPAIFHMRIINENRNFTLLHTLSDIYSSRWPNCVQIKILAAIADLQTGDDTQGVERLHWSAAHDASGQVVTRLLGANHSFKPLWPEDLKVFLDLPIPAAIAAELGWNVLSKSNFVTSGEQELPAGSKLASELLDEQPTLATQVSAFMFDEDEEYQAVQTDYSEVPTSSFFVKDIATVPPEQP